MISIIVITLLAVILVIKVVKGLIRLTLSAAILAAAIWFLLRYTG